MVVTATTNSIDVVLGAAVATNQPHICASYNQVSSTTITPVKNITVTNGTSAVNIVPSPSSGNQHQLRYCNIFNTDTSAVTVTVRMNYNGTTRNVISLTLQVNESLQYTHRTGWKSFDMNGSLKISLNNVNSNNPLPPPFSITASAAGAYTISTTQAIYMGRATGNHKNIMVGLNLTNNGAGFTWAEAAIYRGSPAIGTATSLTRMGFVDIVSNFLSANGVRNILIPVSGINAGDDLWFVIGNSATTSAQVRANTVPDDISAGFVLSATTSRPSTNSTLSPSIVTTGNYVRFTWQGD